jgi:autotransporter-associated beta strand protein
MSIVPQAKATAYVWNGGAAATDTNLISSTNWQGSVAGVGASKGTATLDTQSFGTAGTSKMSITMTAGNRIFGSVTFDALSSTYSSGWTISDNNTAALLLITGDTSGSTPTKASLVNNYTVGNLTFNTLVLNVTTNNTWTSATGANTNFSKAVYVSDAASYRILTLNGGGNFTFNNGIKNTYATGASNTNTTSSQLVINNTGTTTITGAMDLRGQVNINTQGGTVVLDGDNSGVGAGLTRVTGTDTTYAFRFTQGNVKLNNALALGTQDQVLGRSTGTLAASELGVYTNAAITVANNFTLGASTGSNSVLNNYTLGGASANNSTYSGTVLLNKDGRFTQVSGGTVTFSGAITQGSTTRNLTFDGDGNITVSGSLGTGILPIVGSTNASSTRVVTLSGNNTYTGGVTINSGVLAVGSSGALNSTAGSENAITWGAGTSSGTLRLNGNSVTVKSLTTNATAGTPIIENNNAANAVLTIGNSGNADSTFAGVIKDGAAAGTLGINKVGTGTLTLSGTNTYTGATNINAGTLALTGSLASGSTVTVGASGTLKGTGTANGLLNISGTVNPGSAGVGTLTSGATDLKAGGTLNIQFFSGSGAAGSTGWDLLTTGALTTSATSGNKFNINLVSITTLGADTTGSASVFNNAADQTFEIIRASSLATAFDASLFNLSTVGFTNSLGGGSWSLTSSGNSIYANFAKFVAGTISYWSAGTWGDTASGTGGTGSWDNASVSWDATGGKTAVFAGTADTVTVGTVTAKKGITFSTSGYTLSGGSIALADTSGLNTVTVDSGTAVINSSLTGSGGFTKAGAGTLTLSGDNNSLTGGMTIGLGTVKIGSATALGASSSAVSITSGAVLDLNGTTYSNTNALTIAGTGAVINSSNTAASYAGNVTLSAASSIVSTGAITMGGTTNLNGFGLTLTTGAGDITLSNNISGTGALTISPAGAGNVTLSGSSINNSGAIAINSVTGGGNTTISGNIGSSVNGLTIGTINTTGSDRTVTLSGTNTYSGTVTINSGTVKLGSLSAFGNSANSVVSNGYASGVAIDLNGQSVSNNVAAYGTGVGGLGVITNSSATGATMSGNVSFSGNATILAYAGDITFSGALKTSSATNRTITLGGNTSTTTNIYVNSGVLQTNTLGSGYLGLVIGNSGSDRVKVTLSGTQLLQTNGNIKIQGGTLALASSSTLSGSGMSINAGGSTGDNSTLLLTAGNHYTFGSMGVGGNLTFDTTSSATASSITFTAGGNAATNNNWGQTGSSSKQVNVREGVTLVLGSSGATTYFDLVGNAGLATKLLKLDGAGNYTINSSLRDTNITITGIKGGINKTGTGLLILNGANTYTGNTELRGGTTKLGNAAALGDATSNTLVYTGATLDLNGQTMSNANVLNLNAGTITNTSATKATYTGLITVGGNGSTITADAGNIDITNIGTIGLTSGTGYSLTLNGANGGTISSIIGIGTGALNKSGAGNWTLAGTGATYTGTTNITAGTLTLGASNVIGSGAVTVNGGTLAIGANSDSVGTVTLTSGSITGSTGVLTSSSDYAVSSGTISAVLAGAVNLNKTGAGTVTLTGLNTYTGTTYITGGTLEINNFGGTQGSAGGVGANPSSLGSASNISSKLRINNATLRYIGSGETTDKKIQLGSTATIDASGSGALVFSSSPGESWMTGTTDSVLTLTGSNTGNNTWRGDIMNNTTVGVGGVTSLVKSGDGTWVLSGTTSNFTGGTTISGGTLKTGTANIVGNITNNSVLEFTNTTSGSYAGVITGTGSVNKSGAGAVTFTANNDYAGVTNINAGSIVLGSNTGNISGSSAINVYKGGTLKSTNTTDTAEQAATVVLKSGGILDLTAGNLSAGSLTVDTLSGADVTKINFGIGNSLSLGTFALTGNLAVDLLGTPTGAGTYNVLSWTTKSGLGSINLLTQDTQDWIYTTNLDNTNKRYSITIAAAFRDGGNYSTGTVVIPADKTLGDVSGTVTVTAANTTTVGAISGGTVNLSGTGNTVGAVSGGTVNLNASGSTVASLATGGTLNVKADSVVTSLTGGTLSVDSGINAEVKGGTSTATITGAGNLLKTGNGTLTLSGTTSDYTGATNVQSGTVQVTDVSALGSTSGVTMGTVGGATDAKLQIAATGATELSKNIVATNTTSANIVENTGTGALTLSGSLTKNGTVLTLAGGSSGINVTGEIIGSAANSDLVVSSGTVKVSSSNSYNGPTFVEAGATLIADNASATGTGIVNVANGATLQVGTSTHSALTLTTGGFALTNGAIIRVYVGSVDVTGLTINSGSNINTDYAHYDLTTSAGVTYSSLATSGSLDLTGVTAGGITIQVYSTGATTSGFETNPFYDFKFLEAANVTGLGSGLNVADLFTINTSNLKYANGNTVTGVSGWGDYSSLIKVYTVNNGENTVLMMSIPEPSTYGLGLGALALAAVAIRRRKQKKSTV